MAAWGEIEKSLNSCHSLFLEEIGEPQENVLRLLLLEAQHGDEAESMQVGGATIKDLHRVQPTVRSRTFELIWHQYIVYAVTNESFGRPHGEEAEGSGRLLRHYSQSPLLDYVARTTVATKDYPGPYTHVRILSENHIVDVVSTGIPSLHVR